MNLDGRVALTHCRQHPCQQVGRNRRDRSHPQRTGELGRRAVGRLEQLVRFTQDDPGPCCELAPGGRDGDTPPDTLGHGDPHVLLELADLGAQRRLGDEAGRRRPANVAVGVERRQVFQLAHRRAHADGGQERPPLRSGRTVAVAVAIRRGGAVAVRRAVAGAVGRGVAHVSPAIYIRAGMRSRLNRASFSMRC